ncbi:tetratricopeptide repeat protein [Myxosarcina sp. GI1]|uniref:tetratricopeptide repeat protein n=1 Tax=Myxosarcina sp. GI1 TaxID=1541065 RepID=UPI00056BEC44|nr:tetratricopeptide repeat protein [Myxosarcina sp. GI1]
MSEPTSLSDRYFQLIDRIVDNTLKGKIASTERVYRMLLQSVEVGTGEIFERCLAQRISTTQTQLASKLKATRILKALETIEKQWQRWQQENQATVEVTTAVEQILAAEREQYFQAMVEALDPNRERPLNQDKLAKLGQELSSAAKRETDSQLASDLQQLAAGIERGVQSFTAIEPDLISWIYDSGSRFSGFGAEKPNPWRTWSQKVDSLLPKQLFQCLAQSQPLTNIGQVANNLELKAWVELAVLLQYLQRGLVTWFDKQPYNSKFGKQLSYSTFLTFAVVWCELWQMLINSRGKLARGCFLMMLQILRTFARRDDFPLYSGVFVSFSGEYLQNTLEYFDEPLKQAAETTEKARILTLLGYSQRTVGQYAKAAIFHEEALAIARQAKDLDCEIANLNHLSRTYANQKDYSEAINSSQRALILARQVGDKLGEANALVNLGYSQVLSARQLDSINSEVYSEAIQYLERGVELADWQGDFQSQAFGYSSLGIAYVILTRPTEASAALTKGAELAQYSKDVYLQGLSFSYMAEACYTIENRANAVGFGSVGMYLLKQINSTEWRQAAGLLTILQGQIGEAEFNSLLQQQRSQIIALIGVDGYDYVPELLAEYRQR